MKKLWKWTWRHNISLHACQHFCTRAHIFLRTDNSAHISVLPNIKYVVTSRLFSKWDKVWFQCGVSLSKTIHSQPGVKEELQDGYNTSVVIFCCLMDDWKQDKLWFSFAQLVRSRTMNLFNWLYWSSAFESDPELNVRKLHFLWGCQWLELELRQIQAAISPLTPGSPGSDLIPVIRTNCICSVKCAEAAWNYKSGRHSAL